MIDSSEDRPLKRRIADDLRERIRSGQLPPGAELPSERELGVLYACGRVTIRGALAILVAEGLVVKRQSYPTRVRETGEVSVVHVDLIHYGVRTRRATEREARHLDIGAGDPVLVLVETLPAADGQRHEAEIGGPWDGATTELRHRDGASGTDS